MKRSKGGRHSAAPVWSASSDAHGARVSLEALVRLKGAAALPRLATRRRIVSSMSGAYVSPFRGRGIDFDEVRVYQPGDDIRAMDWRVTARTGIPHMKLFREERERSAYLVVDQRPTMFFGSRRVFKSVAAAEAAAWLAWALDEHGDRTGALIFRGASETELRPARGKRAVARLLKALVDSGELSVEPGADTDRLLLAAERVRRVAKPGSLVFFISDFRHLDTPSERHLGQLARHNDVTAIFIYDPLEAQLPPPGRYRISDGHQTTAMETGNKEVIEAYRRGFDERRTKLESFCRKNGIHYLMLGTHQDVAECLPQGLQTRPVNSRQ